MQKSFPLPLAFLLPHERCVSLVGAGGKTSLMYALAQSWISTGRRALCTTTTHILPPAAGEGAILAAGIVEGKLEEQDGLERLCRALAARWRTQSQLTLGLKALENGKWQGFSAQTVCALFRELGRGHDALLLVEADGAARYPLKIAAPHEPVVPECSQLCIGVLGLSALGKSMGESIFRWEQAPEEWGWTAETRVRPEHLALLASHEKGLFVRCPAPMRRLVFCNQADTDVLYAQAAEVLERARALGTVSTWIIGSVRTGDYKRFQF